MAGGARPRSGPPADPSSLKSALLGRGLTMLPKRVGSAPEWPSVPKPTPRELALWRRQWRRPQALLWERYGQAEEVCQFVRALARVEGGEAAVDLERLVKQMRESLYLTPDSLLRAGYDIPADETATPRADKRAAKTASSRTRLEVVPDAAAE